MCFISLMFSLPCYWSYHMMDHFMSQPKQTARAWRKTRQDRVWKRWSIPVSAKFNDLDWLSITLKCDWILKLWKDKKRRWKSWKVPHVSWQLFVIHIIVGFCPSANWQHINHITSKKRRVGTITQWSHARACWIRVEEEMKIGMLIDVWCRSMMTIVCSYRACQNDWDVFS